MIENSNNEIELSSGINKYLVLKFPIVNTASSSQNRFEEHLFGSMPDKKAEITLNYEIKRYESNTYQNNKSKKDSIKFYLNFNNKCGDGYEKITTPTKENINDYLIQEACSIKILASVPTSPISYIDLGKYKEIKDFIEEDGNHYLVCPNEDVALKITNYLNLQKNNNFNYNIIQ